MNTQAMRYVLDAVMNQEIQNEKDGYYDSDWRYDEVGNYWNIQIEVDCPPTRIVARTPLILFPDPSEYGLRVVKQCPYENPECDHSCYWIEAEFEGPEGPEVIEGECSALEEVFESIIDDRKYHINEGISITLPSYEKRRSSYRDLMEKDGIILAAEQGPDNDEFMKLGEDLPF